MKITLWTMTSDTDNGMETSVHLSEADAYKEFVRRWEDGKTDARAHELLDALDLDALDEYLQANIEAGSLDSYSVEQQPDIEVAELPIPSPAALPAPIASETAANVPPDRDGRTTREGQQAADELEAALDAVIDTQSEFWKAVGTLERLTGLNIDDTSIDFQEQTLASLRDQFQ